MIGRSLKVRILLSFLVIISVLSFSMALLGFYIVKKDVIDIAQNKVKSDLSLAREVYRQEIKSVENTIRLVALRFFLRDAVLENNTETLKTQLEEIRKSEGLDVLTLVNKDGRVIVRSRNPSVIGDEQKSEEVVSKVLSEKRTMGATTIVSKAELAKEGQELVEQASIKFVATPKAKPTGEIEQTSGMMIKAGAPVFDYNGNIIGVLYGGNLLNRNYSIVDGVKKIVYQEAKYKGKDIGTVTIFQNDLRISTNVMSTDGNRAIGTRVSQEVYDQVLGQGRPWVNSAFVVNDWYKTSYEPIKNINGQIIGMLYVGTLEQPFNDIARDTMLIFMAIIVAATFLAVAISFVLAAGISRPLTNLLDATAKLSTGELGHTIETETGMNELNKLAVSFNEMSKRLEERDNNLKLSNEKQAELNKRYIDLIGFVSHELKGILATVVMNVCSVQESLLGPINEKQKSALDGATRSLDYLNATVIKFLNLGKIEKGELEVKKATVRLKKSVFDISINSQMPAAIRKNMTIRNEINSDLCIEADKELMQIVATNLIANAIKYGRDYGNIVLSSKIFENIGEIEVYNDSEPIRQEDKDKLFKRFSRLDTHVNRNVKGTGLGLFITKQIIEKHGGKIWVEPRKNGNSFIFQLAI
jgi:two-component system NtrC family sensor kinase